MRVSLHPRSQLLPAALPYLLALLVTAASTAVLYTLRGSISPAIIALLYLLPVGLSAFFWGLGAGILAAFAAFLAFNYFFIPPYYSLFVHQTQDLLALLVFLGVTVVISQMVGRLQLSLANATAREREAVHMAELSKLLAGLRDEQAIAQALAERTTEAFQADRVDIFIEGQPGSQPILLHRAAVNPPAGRKPDMLIPLQSPQGVIGEVRLWRENPPLNPADERLLLAFASQGVLALERGRLSQAETRARILEESDRLKSSLLSSVSHELRTPLATIKAAVTGLQSGEVEWDSESRTDLLAVIEEEADQLDRLVGNLLNMSRIEAGALQPQRSWHHLAEIVDGVVERMQNREITRGSLEPHDFDIVIPEDLPLVPIDYVLMEQVFNNLISNSLKYSPGNSIIKIGAWRADDQSVQVQVSNQGPGVPEEHLVLIFDKFHRITAADRVTGAGMGLSICKGIVEAHGGRIWAENLPGGFAFNFILPLTASTVLR